MTPDAVADLLRAVAPELGAGNLYVVFSSTLPEGVAEAGEFLGVTTPSLDLTLRPHLPWQGRGPCLLLHDAALRAEAAALVEGAGFDEGEAREWAFGRVGLHEVAHILEPGAPFFGAESDAERPLPVAALALVLGVRPEVLRPRGTPPWVGHSLRFIRLAIHAAFRARTRRGLAVSPAAVISNWQGYGLRHPDHYARALGGEPEAMAGRPFREVLAEPCPPEFLRLWRDDTEGNHVAVGASEPGPATA